MTKTQKQRIKDCANFHEYSDDNGNIILLNIEAKIAKSEVYTNPTFNDVIRRTKNMTEADFNKVIDGYKMFRGLFSTKKSMKKYIKREMMREKRLQRMGDYGDRR